MLKMCGSQRVKFESMAFMLWGKYYSWQELRKMEFICKCKAGKVERK